MRVKKKKRANIRARLAREEDAGAVGHDSVARHLPRRSCTCSGTPRTMENHHSDVVFARMRGKKEEGRKEKQTPAREAIARRMIKKA